jgi:hypothetical protein
MMLKKRVARKVPDGYRGDLSCLAPAKGYKKGRETFEYKGGEAYLVLGTRGIAGAIINYYGNNGEGKKAASSFLSREEVLRLFFAASNRWGFWSGPFRASERPEGLIHMEYLGDASKAEAREAIEEHNEGRREAMRRASLSEEAILNCEREPVRNYNK